MLRKKTPRGRILRAFFTLSHRNPNLERPSLVTIVGSAHQLTSSPMTIFGTEDELPSSQVGRNALSSLFFRGGHKNYHPRASYELDAELLHTDNEGVLKPTSTGDSLATTLQALKNCNFFNAFLISVLIALI